MDNSLKVPAGKNISQVKLSYHPEVKTADRPKITSAEEAYSILLANWDMDLINLQEQVRLLLLDNGNRILGIVDVSTGGIASSIVDLRIVFAAALTARATSIMLAHNHPSGGTRPSAGDDNITRKVSQAARTLDIRFMDHLIITPESYYSYADNGML